MNGTSFINSERAIFISKNSTKKSFSLNERKNFFFKLFPKAKCIKSSRKFKILIFAHFDVGMYAYVRVCVCACVFVKNNIYNDYYKLKNIKRRFFVIF